MIRQLSGFVSIPSSSARLPSWTVSIASAVRGLTQSTANTQAETPVASQQESPPEPAKSGQENAAPSQQGPPSSQPPAGQRSALHQAKHHSALVRIAPTQRRPVDLWTAYDVLSFLQDPSLTVSDLSVEYDHRLRPMAWWVRYKSAEKASKVVQALGSTRLGTTDVTVMPGDKQHLAAELKRTLQQAGGCTVVWESEQELKAEKIEKWLQGSRLSETKQRVRVYGRAPIEEGKRPLSRAVVTFSSPEEAAMATWKHNKQLLGLSPVWLRVLP